MKRKQRWMTGLALLGMAAIALLHLTFSTSQLPGDSRVLAQSPQPSPTAPPAASAPNAQTAPAIPIPPVPIPPSVTPPPSAPPASTAPPLELSGTYEDPAGRFQVGVLSGYKVSPLAGSVLIESPTGQVAYTVVAQSQPFGNPIGLIAGYDNNESLAKIATAVFQRGESFQPAPSRAEAGGGAVMNWTGTLTIGGTSQPIAGVVLVRPNAQNILLLMIAATQTGQDQVPGALSALANSLQAM